MPSSLGDNSNPCCANIADPSDGRSGRTVGSQSTPSDIFLAAAIGKENVLVPKSRNRSPVPEGEPLTPIAIAAVLVSWLITTPQFWQLPRKPPTLIA